MFGSVYKVPATPEQLRDVLQSMVGTLAASLNALDRLASGPAPATFLAYRKLRETYLEARDLIDAMEMRGRDLNALVPARFFVVMVQSKLRALSAYTLLADAFFREPPETVSRSLVAHEVLSDEREHFRRALAYFDQMLMEAEVDDKMADRLEETRQRLERIIAGIDLLLIDSPKPLTVFA